MLLNYYFSKIRLFYDIAGVNSKKLQKSGSYPPTKEVRNRLDFFGLTMYLSQLACNDCTRGTNISACATVNTCVGVN